MTFEDPRFKHRLYFEVDTDTLQTLLEFSNLLKQGELLSLPKSISNREYEKMYREWRRNPPSKVEQKANMIGIAQGIHEVDPFYRRVFAELYPEKLPTGKIGRPENYVPESRREKMRIGQIVTRLLSLSGDALRTELESSQKAA